MGSGDSSSTGLSIGDTLGEADLEPFGEDLLDSNPDPDVHSAVRPSLSGSTRVTGTTPTADGTTLYKNVLMARGLSDFVALGTMVRREFGTCKYL